MAMLLTAPEWQAAFGRAPLSIFSRAILISGVYAARHLQSSWLWRHLDLFPVFGEDPSRWDASFPLPRAESLQQTPAEPREPSAVLLVNAADDWGAENDTPQLAKALRRWKGPNVTVDQVIIPNTNHITIIQRASTGLLPALRAWIAGTDQLPETGRAGRPKND